LRNEVRVSDTDEIGKLRHDLANPLSALLAETQLLLLDRARLEPEVVKSLQQIESLAIRMRGLIRGGAA
jgi:signal transduction histidine kinase